MLDTLKYAVFEMYRGILDWLIGIACFAMKKRKETSLQDYEAGKISRKQYLDKVRRLEQVEALKLKLQASRL